MDQIIEPSRINPKERTLSKTKTKLYHYTVTHGFRRRVIEMYPGLGDKTRYWRILQHCLYGVRRDGKLLVPQDFVYQLADNNSHKYSAEEILQDFEQSTGINLNVSEYRWTDGQARTIEPELCPELLQAFVQELNTPADKKTDKVDFVSGRKRTTRKHRRELQKYDRYLQDLAADASKDHPARELIELLNKQPISVHERQYKRTLNTVMAAAEQTLTGDKQTYASSTLSAIGDCAATRYKPSQSGRTCRIFAIGQSLNALPSKLRDLLLAGCDQFDLRSAQLSIAAKHWELQEFTEFLSGGTSIWAELASHCQVPLDYKPILKATIYSICYGMGMTKLMTQLADGDDKDPGIGQEAAERFFAHPLVSELLAGRKVQLIAITRAGGAMDAFGRWLAIPWEASKPKPQSVLAQVAQSHELIIMLQILPILRANPQIQVLSWLHDGIVLRLSNASKRDRWLQQITETVDSYCRLHGYCTSLEHEHLPEPQILASAA